MLFFIKAKRANRRTKIHQHKINRRQYRRLKRLTKRQISKAIRHGHYITTVDTCCFNDVATNRVIEYVEKKGYSVSRVDEQVIRIVW